ncbi:MAG: hypothetical protein WED00_05645 [Aquisalimonadaceae bacterium]
MSDLALVIGNTRHRGWLSVDIRRGLDQIADSFDLSLTERWDESSEPRPVRAGEPCRVEIDGELVLTGYVDDVLPSYDDKSHTIVASGRSRTADLVDCSAGADTWTDRTLLAIARRLAEPFGIEVIADVDTGAPFRTAGIEEGQPFAEALEQLARIRAVHLVTDAQGRLVITRPGQARTPTALVLGENIRKASGRFTLRDRFSDYQVLAQQNSNDNVFARAAAEPSGMATDGRITRYRPTVILADTATDSAGCEERARWERAKRWGSSRGVTYTVHGWRHRDGLWTPSHQVRVRDRWMGFDDWMLIAGVQHLLDQEGERTEIRVVPPEAYDRIELPEPEAEDSGWAD